MSTENEQLQFALRRIASIEAAQRQQQSIYRHCPARFASQADAERVARGRFRLTRCDECYGWHIDTNQQVKSPGGSR